MQIRLRVVDITPPAGVPPTVTAWRSGRDSLPADWQDEPFQAKALMMEHDGGRFLLITTDLLWVSDQMRGSVEAAAQVHGLSPDSVMIAASHTHSGPQTLRTENPMPGAPDNAYLRSMEAALSGLVGSVLEAEPTVVTPGLAFGRRPGLIQRLKPVWVPTIHGGLRRRLQFLPHSRGPRDEQVSVLGLFAADRRPVAVVYGYSCHPTVLNGPGPSRDYPGATSDRIRERTGAEAFFLLGFSGDLRPDLRVDWRHTVKSPKALARCAIVQSRPFRFGSYSEMLQFGRGLGDEVVRALDGMREIAPGPLEARLIQVSVPMKLGGTAPLSMQRFSIGCDLAILGIGSEVFQEFSASVREAIPATHIWPVSLANGVISYLYPERLARFQPYGSGMSIRPELGIPATFTEEVVRTGLKALASTRSSDRIPRLTIQSVTDPEYPECRLAYAEYSPRYRDPDVWRQRMLGVDGKRLIAVGAYDDDGRWAGGVITYAVPMRGPAGELLAGGKMEAMIVSKHARGRVFLFDDGRVEKLSVALSRRLIDVSLDAGLKIIYGVPNEPAYAAHRLAGHGLVHLEGYRLERALGPGFWTRYTGKRALALRAIGMWQIARPGRRRETGGLRVAPVSHFAEDVDVLDEARAGVMPGVDMARLATLFNWRYVGAGYVRLECRDSNGRIVGTLIGQEQPEGGVVVLIDIAASPDCPTAWIALVSAFLDLVREAGAHTVTFTSVGDGGLARRQRDVLRQAGFFQHPRAECHWIVDAVEDIRKEDLLDSARWSFSGMFSDSL